MTREEALLRTNNECERQEQLWGGHMHDAGHTPEEWALLLQKHIGKLADLSLGTTDIEIWIHRLEVISALAVSAMVVAEADRTGALSA